MKKVILLLMIAILSVALTGCNKQEDVVETHLIKLDAETNEDVINIMNIYNVFEKADRIPLYLDNQIRGIKNNSSSLYLSKINDTNYIILCAYYDDKDKDIIHPNFFYKSTWYACDNIKYVENEFDGKVLGACFVAYNITIIKNVISDKKINKISKYYKQLDKFSKEIRLEYTDLLIYENIKYIEEEKCCFSNGIFEDRGYETRYDSNGKERVVFKRYIYSSNGKWVDYEDGTFANLYSYFQEWLMNEKDCKEIMIDGKRQYFYKKVSIDLDKFRELIKEIELEE